MAMTLFRVYPEIRKGTLMRLASLIVAITLCVWSQFGQGQVLSPPNVILVLVDDMGWSDVGAFGGEIETPHIGRLIAHLERSGKLDQTVILFTSDNGASAEFVPAATGEGEIGEQHPIGSVGRWATLGGDWANVANTPFRHYKNHPFEGGAASPLIAHWPDGILEPGRVVSANAHLIDLFPTLLSVTGASKAGAAAGLLAESPQLEGMDLSAHFQSSDPIERPQPVFQRWGLGRSVRTDRWKLLSQGTAEESGLRLFLRWRAQQAAASEPSKPPATPPVEQGDWQLYDMSVDRTETTNVSVRHPEVVAEMASAYEEWLRRVKPESD